MNTNTNTLDSFDSFGVEHIPEEILRSINNKIIITNTLRIKAYDSMCGHFYIGFIYSMLNSKSLRDFMKLFYLKNLKKEWSSDSRLYFEIKFKHEWRKCMWHQIR